MDEEQEDSDSPDSESEDDADHWISEKEVKNLLWDVEFHLQRRVQQSRWRHLTLGVMIGLLVGALATAGLLVGAWSASCSFSSEINA